MPWALLMRGVSAACPRSVSRPTAGELKAELKGQQVATQLASERAARRQIEEVAARAGGGVARDGEEGAVAATARLQVRDCAPLPPARHGRPAPPSSSLRLPCTHPHTHTLSSGHAEPHPHSPRTDDPSPHTPNQIGDTQAELAVERAAAARAASVASKAEADLAAAAEASASLAASRRMWETKAKEFAMVMAHVVKVHHWLVRLRLEA